MKQNKPLVSVIMPVYNAGNFLVEAIESVLKQTYDNLELIIVDDGSTDDSRKIAKHYAKQYPKKVHSYKTKEHTNAAGNGAMNYGFRYAKGEFIARMDADDISKPRRIEKQVAYMVANPQTIVLGTQAMVIDKKGKTIGRKTMPTKHEQIYNQYGVFHPLIHPSVMIRRSLLPRQDAIYSMKYDVNDDYYTFFRLLNYGKFANLPDYLLNYRIHGANMSLTHAKAKFIDSVRIRIDAMQELGYKMSLSSLILMMVQIIIIFPLPERLIVPLYMSIRGIQIPSVVRLLIRIKKRFPVTFSQKMRYA